MKKIIYIFSALLFAIVISGCAASGAKFVAAKPAPSNMALVYLYRPKAYSGSGVRLPIIDNGRRVATLTNGQFIRYQAKPGKHTFNTKTLSIDKPISVSLKAGQTYYIRSGLRTGLFAATWYLSQVFPSEAVPEMQSCCKAGS